MPMSCATYSLYLLPPEQAHPWGEVVKGQRSKLMGRKREEGKEGKREKEIKKLLKRGWIWC